MIRSRYIIQTTHGSYPTGVWAYCGQAETMEAAIRVASQFEDTRVFDIETGKIVWPEEQKDDA